MRQFLLVKGSALHFSILVATIVVLLLSSFLLLSKTQFFFKQRSADFVKEANASSKGLRHYLQFESSAGDSISYNYLDSNLFIEQSFWGGFEKCISTSEQTGFKKMALAGSGFYKSIPSIVLQDNFMPLAVVGNTYLEGTAILPESGVKAGSMAGQYYSGERLVYGAVQDVNDKGFPKISKPWKRYIEDLTKYIPSTYNVILDNLTDAQNSFFDATKYYYATEPIVLTQELSGNLIIKSETAIVVEQNSAITDAFLIAPTITINENVAGRMHLVSTDSIIIKKGVRLEYPSSLVLLDKTEDQNQGFIKIAKDALIQGNVIYLSDTTEEIATSSIILETGSEVRGAVYCQGALDVQGIIQGSAMTYYTLASENGQRYKNHLFDAKIMTKNVPINSAGIPLENTQKSIALWLY